MRFARSVIRNIYEILYKALLLGSALKKLDPDTEIILSLTTFPSRGFCIFWAILSLKRQEIRPSIIYVTLFPAEYNVRSLRRLTSVLKFIGVTVLYADRNYKAMKKYYPLKTESLETTSFFAVFDDDVLYAKGVIKSLRGDNTKWKVLISGCRGKIVRFKNSEEEFSDYVSWLEIKEEKIGRDCFVTGVGGVMYTKSVIDLLRNQIITNGIDGEQFYTGDDILIWKLAYKNHINIRCVGETLYFDQKLFRKNSGLYLNNVNNGGNDVLMNVKLKTDAISREK